MEVLLSMIGGGATGLLGTIFDRVFGHIEKREERKFILQKYQIDLQERAKERENQFAIAENNSATDALISSYEHDANIGIASQWVINFLRLVRPTITILLWLIVLLIWLSLDAQYDFKNQIISTVLYCATAATLWWFGTRDKRKFK